MDKQAPPAVSHPRHRWPALGRVASTALCLGLAGLPGLWACDTKQLPGQSTERAVPAVSAERADPDPESARLREQAIADEARRNHQAQERHAMRQRGRDSNPPPTAPVLDSQAPQSSGDAPDAFLDQMRLDFVAQFNSLEPTPGIPVRFMSPHMQASSPAPEGTFLTEREDGVVARITSHGRSSVLSFNPALAYGPALAIRFRILNETASTTPYISSFGVYTGTRRHTLGIVNHNYAKPTLSHTLYLYLHLNNQLAFCYAHDKEDGTRYIGPIETRNINEGPLRVYLGLNPNANVLIEEVRAP